MSGLGFGECSLVRWLNLLLFSDTKSSEEAFPQLKFLILHNINYTTVNLNQTYLLCQGYMFYIYFFSDKQVHNTVFFKINATQRLMLMSYIVQKEIIYLNQVAEFIDTTQL